MDQIYLYIDHVRESLHNRPMIRQNSYIYIYNLYIYIYIIYIYIIFIFHEVVEKNWHHIHAVYLSTCIVLSNLSQNTDPLTWMSNGPPPVSESFGAEALGTELSFGGRG